MSPEERFWSKVDQTGDCWLWTAGCSDRGYGVFALTHSKQVLAHRYAYEQMIGPIDQDLDHRHTCPKRCVRPLHLRPATKKQNGENRAGAQSNSRSGIRGVFWETSRSRWCGAVYHHGRRIVVGRFLTSEEAEAAVIAKRLELFTYNDADRVMV